MGKQMKTRLWGQSQLPVGLCGLFWALQKGHAWPTSYSSMRRREQPPGVPVTSQCCLQGAPSCCRTSSAPAAQMDRNSYFWLRFPLCMLIYILEHTTEKEPWIRGLVWLITPWAHNPPHNSKPHLLLNCPPFIMVLSSSKVRKIGGSLLRSSLFSVIISWK